MNSKIPEKLLILFNAFSEGTLSESQQSELDDILSADKAACECFIEFVNMCAVLKGGKVINEEFGFNTCGFESASADITVKMDSSTSLRGIDLDKFRFDTDYEDPEKSGLTQEILEILELEMTSPAVEVPKEERKEKTEREPIQKVVYPPRPKRKLTKFQKFQLGACAAAVLVLAAIIFFTPDPVILPVVAELIDSIDAVWDSKLQTPDEYGDMVQSRYRLNKGFITILLNDGAKVTVEAPAELSLNSGGDMELFSGRIYAVVPDRAKGFTVKAGNSKIVDLGTEFGVEIDKSGSTELHVTRGSTVLLPGLFKESRKRIEVTQGSAKKVYNDGFVNDIKLEDSKFVRHIDSKNNMVVRYPLVEVFYEPFDYAEDFLEDVSDWIKVDGVLPDRGILVKSTGLDYGILPVTGGRIVSGNRFDRTRGHTLNGAVTAIADAGLLADGQTLWFSVVVETLVSENTTLVVALGTDYVNSYFQIDGGSGDSVGFDITNGNDFRSRYFIGGTAVDTGFIKRQIPNGEPVMLVMEMIWNEDSALPDTLNYYMPDENLSMGSPIATLDTVAFNQAAFDTFSVSICGKVALDEIRFGKSYSDVIGGR